LLRYTYQYWTIIGRLKGKGACEPRRNHSDDTISRILPANVASVAGEAGFRDRHRRIIQSETGWRLHFDSLLDMSGGSIQIAFFLERSDNFTNRVSLLRTICTLCDHILPRLLSSWIKTACFCSGVNCPTAPDLTRTIILSPQFARSKVVVKAPGPSATANARGNLAPSANLRHSTT
jgi:hypothetical protein